jgi:adenylosuccinate synthase
MPVLTEANTHQVRTDLYWNPTLGLNEDLHDIYAHNQVEIGWPDGAKRLNNTAREFSKALIGAMYGDEGKGRLIDNYVELLLDQPGIKEVYVIRYQGGSNAGHTVEGKTPSGLLVKLDMHQVPSGVFHPQAKEVIAQGTVIHTEDLITEIEYIEKATQNDLHGKLFLSEDATLVTDLERAEEGFNRILSGGRSDGGTSRGISPAYASRLDRTGKLISHLMAENWEEELGKKYDFYNTYFKAFETDIATMTVPDFKEARNTGKNIARTVGDKKTFLERLGKARNELIKRKMVVNTNELLHKIYPDKSIAILMEGAQGLGLRRNIGIIPDVTSSDTSAFGIDEGTGVLRYLDMADIMAVLKATYTSKVPFQPLPTAIKLPDDFPKLIEGPTIIKDYIQSHFSELSADQKWVLWVMEYAHEVGVTSLRPRPVLRPDWESLRYFLSHSGAEVVGDTHLDVARLYDPTTGQPELLKVGHHYEDNEGHTTFFEPRIDRLKDKNPVYLDLPGWDGEEVRRARSWEELPLAAKQFLALQQRRTGYPVTVATSGPQRDHIIKFPGYEYVG